MLVHIPFMEHMGNQCQYKRLSNDLDGAIPSCSVAPCHPDAGLDWMAVTIGWRLSLRRSTKWWIWSKHIPQVLDDGFCQHKSHFESFSCHFSAIFPLDHLRSNDFWVADHPKFTHYFGLVGISKSATPPWHTWEYVRTLKSSYCSMWWEFVIAISP